MQPAATRWEDHDDITYLPFIPDFGFDSATVPTGTFDGCLWPIPYHDLTNFSLGWSDVSILSNDCMTVNTASQQYTSTDHGMASVPVPFPTTVSGALDDYFVPHNDTASASFEQFAAECWGPYHEAHVSPVDLSLRALCDTPLELRGPSFASPPIHSPLATTPPSYADGLRLNPVSPAAGSEWAVYSPSAGSSSTAGSSTLHSAYSSPSPISPDTPPIPPMQPLETEDEVHRKSAASRGLQPNASLSVPSLTSSFPGRLRTTAPRNKQVRFKPYEVPDGDFDSFVCPHCEPGHRFSTPRRGRRKQDIERHLKTHFIEATRSSSKSCNCIVPIEDLPGPKPPNKWYEYEGRTVVGGCGKLFSRSDSFIRHLKAGCLGPDDS